MVFASPFRQISHTKEDWGDLSTCGILIGNCSSFHAPKPLACLRNYCEGYLCGSFVAHSVFSFGGPSLGRFPRVP